MLDPSLLLSARTASMVRRDLRTSQSSQTKSSWHGRCTQRRWAMSLLRSLADLFGPKRRAATSTFEDLGWLRDDELVQPFAAGQAGESRPLYGDAFAVLAEREDVDVVVANLLLEQWVFLNTQSWIAARTHRTFAEFKKAGAAAVELPREAFDAITRRTLKIPAAPVPRPLKQSERLKAATKWVAAGGSPSLGRGVRHPCWRCSRVL